MQTTYPPSAAAYAPPASQRVLTNTLVDLLYCSATGTMKPKAVARDLELLAADLADQGADDATLATVWELAARIRHAKYLAKVAAERHADQKAARLRPVA